MIIDGGWGRDGGGGVMVEVGGRYWRVRWTFSWLNFQLVEFVG